MWSVPHRWDLAGFAAVPKLYKFGYPIVEVADGGLSIITMYEGCNSAVMADTVKAQLIYEIQGPIYINTDVAACLEGIRIQSISNNSVKVTGFKGIPPQPMTKLAVCTLGGYQAKLSTYAVGLDVRKKAVLQIKQRH
ncbi:hypothetical protein M426DRAFT_220777 [Hypoxylon sp. CI-4A]|nr:hypothetical protein M426DRAFT_220777 [Hypoxylon sp. CI-4A]